MIYVTPKLSAKDREVLERIDGAKETLRHRLSVPRRWTGLLRRSTLGRAMRGSNSIEGYRIAKKDVVAAAVGESVEADEQTKKAVECYRRAMTFVLQASRDASFRYSTGILKAVHFMLQEYDMDKNPGQYRPGSIYVVDEEKNETVYEGPDDALVATLVEELVTRIAEEDASVPPIVRAAMAHLNLAMIHPFSDGNGRMARCLQTLVLGRAGVLEPPFSSIEEYLGEHQRAYYDILSEVGRGSWHPENDAAPWMRFSLRAHFIQAQTLVRRTSESDRLYNALAEEVEKRGLPERMTMALFDAASGFNVKNGTYRSAADITEQVASKDLRALVEAGLLVAEGEKRARQYQGAPILFDIRRRIAEPKHVDDPYLEPEKAVVTGTTTVGSPTTILGVSTPSSTGPGQPPVQFRPGEQRKGF